MMDRLRDTNFRDKVIALSAIAVVHPPILAAVAIASGLDVHVQSTLISHRESLVSGLCIAYGRICEHDGISM